MVLNGAVVAVCLMLMVCDALSEHLFTSIDDTSTATRPLSPPPPPQAFSVSSLL